MSGFRTCRLAIVVVGVVLRQQQEQLSREQEKMRRAMECVEQRARDEARQRDAYTKSLEDKFDKERQEYRRQVGGQSSLKPKFHYADYATKSETSSRQSHGLVADTNHESPRPESRRRLS